MIIGVFSDVHGNLAALHRVLARLEDADALFHLGDLVGRGDVNACIRLLADRGVLSVAGGHDLDALAPPDRSGLVFLDENGREIADDFGLSQENREILRNLPLARRLEAAGETMWFAHGMIVDPAHPGIMEIVDERNGGAFVQRLASAGAKPPLAVFVGHSHIPRWFVVRGASVVRGGEVRHSAEVPLVVGATIIVDVGTVAIGAYAVADTTSGKVTIHAGA